MPEQLFDSWPDRYRRWFETPIGRLVKAYESRLALRLLQPQPGEMILDAGCGSGIFTAPMLDAGAQLVGVDLSAPMLAEARRNLRGDRFSASVGNICALPFADQSFDKVVSITALEFIEDAQSDINELFRVSRTGGSVVVATLNSLSPWAERRTKQAEGDPGSVFREIYFRSPAELAALAACPARIETAIHFPKSATPQEAARLEAEGEAHNLDSGAFVIARWTV
ncbi:MAG: methyltransferase domain-containing protein [Candidatus Thiodiazotropha sp.]